MAKIYGWDLNFWNVNDGSIDNIEDVWKLSAYPISDDNSVIGGHSIFVSLTLDGKEVNHFETLGLDLQDSWIDCDELIQAYQVPDRILNWLESLPMYSEEIPN